MQEPATLTAGDTWAWTRSLSEYPAPTWTLTYTLHRATERITFDATADGEDHAVTVPAATTAGYGAGNYEWTSTVSDGTDRFTVGSGRMDIKPDPASATPLDTRSHVRKTLEAIEAVIENRATKEQEEYQITTGGGNQRRLKLLSLDELLTMRDRYAQYVADEDARDRVAQGLGNPRRIVTRFSRVS